MVLLSIQQELGYEVYEVEVKSTSCELSRFRINFC